MLRNLPHVDKHSNNRICDIDAEINVKVNFHTLYLYSLFYDVLASPTTVDEFILHFIH